MSQNTNEKKRLLESLEYIDDGMLSDTLSRVKTDAVRPSSVKMPLLWAKQIALIAACALLLGSVVPVVSYISSNPKLSGDGIGAGDAPEETDPPIENTEVIEETEPIVYPTDLMVEYGWSPKEITNEDADEIIKAFLAKDSDPNKFAYTYSVRCYAKYTGDENTVYAVMIDSDRWTYEEKVRVEQVFYNSEDPNLHIDFIFPSEQPLWIYTDGGFYTMNEAMEGSLLSFSQLLQIRWPDRKGGGFSSFVYPIWLSHSELVEVVHSNPETYTGGWNFRCYGKYDGVYVLFADKKLKAYEPKETSETVNGLTFVYPNENKLQVCANGTFYSLAEALENNVLSAEQLAEVHNVYIMESKIRAEFLAKYGNEFPDIVVKDERISVHFQGIYDDVYVAVIAADCYNNTKSPSETVNGITFTWFQQYDIHVYKDGEFYTLTEAFEKGLITAARLEEVHTAYNTAFDEMFGDGRIIADAQ